MTHDYCSAMQQRELVMSVHRKAADYFRALEHFLMCLCLDTTDWYTHESEAIDDAAWEHAEMCRWVKR